MTDVFKVKYEPSVCIDVTVPPDGDKPESVVAALFSGHVMIRVPSYDERCALRDIVQNCDKSMLIIAARVAKGELTKDQAAAEIMDKGQSAGMSITRAIVKLIPEYVVDVHIERRADGYKYKSVNELLYDEGCHRLVEEIGGALFMKVQIGANGPELRQN